MPLPGAFLGQFTAFVNSYFCRAFAHALQSVGNFFASLIGFGILSSLLPVGCTLYFNSTFSLLRSHSWRMASFGICAAARWRGVVFSDFVLISSIFTTVTKDSKNVVRLFKLLLCL